MPAREQQSRGDGEGREGSRADEGRFENLLEASPEAVLLLDSEGRVERVNQSALELFGYERCALEGVRVGALLPGLEQELGALGAREGARVIHGLDRQGVARGGARLELELSLGISHFGGAPRVTLLARDVSEQRAIEVERARLFARERAARKEAEREHARLAAVLGNAPVGILFIEKGSARLAFNEELRRLFGGEVGDERSRLERLRRRDGSPLLGHELPSARALGGEEVREARLRIVDDDRSVPVLATAVPVTDEGGEVVAACLTLLDVTSREALDRFREEYVSLISHDLKNPLAGMLLRAQLLGRSLAERGQADDLRNVRLLLDSGQRLGAMLDELRDVTQLEGGCLPLFRVCFSARGFLEGVVERALPERERARVRVCVAPGTPPLFADPARLERVVVNLLTNAVKYGTKGAPIEVSAAPCPRGVALRVHNEGPALSAEEARRIFEKHYRARGAKGRAEGLGLGLYISRLLVEAHSGRVRVEPNGRTGVTFLVQLPAAEPASEGL